MARNNPLLDSHDGNLWYVMDRDRYLGLIAALIRSGLAKENWAYPLTDDGQSCCFLGNLDPEYVSKRSNQSLKGRRNHKVAID